MITMNDDGGKYDDKNDNDNDVANNDNDIVDDSFD